MEQDNHSQNREEKNQTPFIDLLSSDELDRQIKKLSAPSFLGSIHLKKKAYQNISSVENVSKGEGDLKVSDSIKHAVFNPITKILLVAAITFNVIWFIIKFIL
mgnify:CR=1 FL=1